MQSPTFYVMARATSQLILATLIFPGLLACSKDAPTPLRHVMPATAATEITFDEAAVSRQCIVFSQLIISLPARMPATRVKTNIEQFARAHGADILLFGLARESAHSSADLAFHAYGPETPYLFAKSWVGWKFGFSDWDNGGPLVNFGQDRLSGEGAAFNTPVDAQAILLSCTGSDQ